MRTLIVSVFSLLLLSCNAIQASLPDGVTLIDKKQVKAGEIGISYEKYRLKNGLTVVLHQDNSDPLAHVDMTYHVGSAREELGRSGFAHFFEHMMFQGSKHVANQQHLKLVTEAGGDVNGSTNRDRTNYYQTIPSNQLEKILWLESDRMGFLLEAVSQEKFEIQCDTVINERAQNFDNRPYGLIGETMSAAFFPKNHPYSWPTIGYVDEINRASLSDLKAFFLNWYGPNNATLTIGGDIDIPQTLAWVNKYFAEIPKGPEVAKNEIQPVKLEKDKFVTLEDKIIQPLLVMAWPTEHPDSSANLALDMLASQLGQGRNSLLFQSLVKSNKALSVNASQDCGELACMFKISVLGKQGQNLNELYQLVNTELEKLALNGIDEQKLVQEKNMAESNAIFSLESVSGKVSQLAINQTFYDDPDRLKLWLDKLNAVKAKEVEKALFDYVLAKPKVVLSVVPKKKASLAVQKATVKVTRPKDVKNTPLSNHDIAKQLAARETPITFDRSQMPKPQPAANVKVPVLYKTKLDNNISLVGSFMNEMPTVSMHLVFPAGKMMEPEDKIGLSAITSKLMQEGTQKNTSEQISAKLENLGATVSLYSTNQSTVLSLSSMKKNLAESLAIATEILFEPRFDKNDFNRLKKQTLERIAMARQTSGWLAEQAKRTVLYQDAWHRTSSAGTKETINNITLADVKAFYQENYTPSKAQIIVVGDIKEKEAKKALAFFAQWQGREPQTEAKVKLNLRTSSEIWLVDKPHAPQTLVKFVRHAPTFDATGEMYKLQLANFPLAGNFNSRLNLNLREDKGYTYGAEGWLFSTKNLGVMEFSTSVRAATTIDTIQEIKKELKNIVTQGFNDEELSFMRLAIGAQQALQYETPSDKANLISYITHNQLPDNFAEKQDEILRSISKDELNKLASKWFDPADYQIIVVGDAKQLQPELQKLGLKVNKLAF